uniref:Uncharacterized protein n=1 Tax=Trichogramma kaykai TaxID=54128 RepID=A0ABD2WQP1_9HYME
MTNLFKLANNFFETPILPNSKYALDKLLNNSGVEYHAVCQTCSAYLGQHSKDQPYEYCTNCNSETQLKNPSDENYFILIDPSVQIADLLHTYEDHYDYVMNKRIPNNENIMTDVYDGNVYTKFVSSLPPQQQSKYVTIIFNTDGAPKFENSKKSIWPIYLMLHELPQQERMNNLICCGLWFNEKKPDMILFMDKFVNMFNNITSQGIRCNIKNEDITITPYIVSCCVDSVARAPMQGMKQFNGYYGCNWCLHPGEHDGVMMYTLQDVPVSLRTHEDTLQLMLQSDIDHINFGVKYASPLINLPSFNIVDGFVPDYMHFCLEGVAK